MKNTIAFLILVLIQVNVFAQDDRVLEGQLKDKKTGKELPFASVTLKQLVMGTISNQNGSFTIQLPARALNDTLQVSYLGYNTISLPISSIKSPIVIELEPSSFELAEVVIRPKSPTYYIQLAVKKIKENYPENPFRTQAYFSGLAKENGNFLEYKEGVFNTYYPAYQDTNQNQHQLLLQRKEKNTHELSFMKEELEKEEAKERRKSKKNKSTEKTVADTTSQDGNNESIEVAGLLGGPDFILDLLKLDGEVAYLDSNNFKKYNYSFGEPTTYDGKKVMVIHFKARKKVEHTKINGTIYIDEATDAIVSISGKGMFKLPGYIRPLLFLMGLGIKNPNLDFQMNYKQQGDKWYPLNARVFFDLQLTRKRMFSANEVSKFDFVQVFAVNRFKLDGVTPIEKEKQFDSNKDFEKQVYNDEGLEWKDINVVKRN